MANIGYYPQYVVLADVSTPSDTILQGGLGAKRQTPISQGRITYKAPLHSWSTGSGKTTVPLHYPTVFSTMHLVGTQKQTTVWNASNETKTNTTPIDIVPGKLSTFESINNATTYYEKY